MFRMATQRTGMPGATNINACPHFAEILGHHIAAQRYTAAICAAPAVVLASRGLLAGKTATCYPAAKFEAMVPSLSAEDVVVDLPFITSKGPGTAMAFSLQLVEVLFGKVKADAVADEMLFIRQ
jgi:4-methyl-5(b-hydroxyethyl)-thiazole monophosphate biosynthesis